MAHILGPVHKAAIALEVGLPMPRPVDGNEPDPCFPQDTLVHRPIQARATRTVEMEHRTATGIAVFGEAEVPSIREYDALTDALLTHVWMNRQPNP